MTMNGVYGGTSVAGILQYEQWLGQQTDMILTHLDMRDWAKFEGSAAGYARDVWSQIDRPVLWSIPLVVQGATLEQGATGAYNAHYVKVAQWISQYTTDETIYIRPGWEFNGDWMPWAAKGHEQAYIETFQQLVDSFRSVSDRFKFEWCVNSGDYGMDPATAYPGDSYVDFIGMDFYQDPAWVTTPESAWKNMLDRPYGLKWLEDFASAHGKQSAYSEWGVGADNMGPYIELAKNWFNIHDVAYQTYWNSNAGGYVGKLSDGQFPNLGDAYRDYITGVLQPAIDNTIVGDPVEARDDLYSVDAGSKLYLHSKYFLMNDYGPDGGLTATVSSVSANGVALEKWADGTLVYRAGTVNGTDRIDYVLTDANGSTDTGSVVITIKNGSVSASPPPPTTGTGNPVDAKDDAYSVDAGKKLYFNTKYILANDYGPDGGLKATIGSTSANGVALEKWADGTIVYRAGTVNGTDRIDYVLTDVDGSTDTASVNITIKNGTVSASPTPPSSGTGNPVDAKDDAYSVDAGKKLYFNTKYILANDYGPDGGLKATIGSTSANGVALEKWADGTVVYKAGALTGTDRIDYVLTDVDGSTDTASVHITIKNGTATASPTAPSTSTVVARDDSYKVDAGKTLYFNTKYVTWNDTGTGALKVTAVDAVSERGVSVSWAADGTTIYRAQAGFQGQDKINYKVEDQAGGYDVGTVVINVDDPFQI